MVRVQQEYGCIQVLSWLECSEYEGHVCEERDGHGARWTVNMKLRWEHFAEPFSYNIFWCPEYKVCLQPQFPGCHGSCSAMI